jgi:hypothetical protein
VIVLFLKKNRVPCSGHIGQSLIFCFTALGRQAPRDDEAYESMSASLLRHEVVRPDLFEVLEQSVALWRFHNSSGLSTYRYSTCRLVCFKTRRVSGRVSGLNISGESQGESLVSGGESQKESEVPLHGDA